MPVTLVALRSKFSPKKYLRLDGKGVTDFLVHGGGNVNTSTSIGPYETFQLERYDNGTVAFKSTAFRDVYLRLDGSHVNKGELYPPGSGVVNAQFKARSWEKFKIVKKQSKVYEGAVGIESNEYPGRYLRIDGENNVVNVQGVFLILEEWEILVIG